MINLPPLLPLLHAVRLSSPIYFKCTTKLDGPAVAGAHHVP
jgi:hypothetical protein